MIQHILVAVDDSVESVEAARTAARLASDWHAAIRILTVVASEADAGRREAAEDLVAHVVREVAAAGGAEIVAESRIERGEPFRCILAEARAWPADLIVMAVSDRKRLRSPYVGSETEHVLEFTECPVLVVPGRRRKDDGHPFV